MLSNAVLISGPSSFNIILSVEINDVFLWTYIDSACIVYRRTYYECIYIFQ